MNATEKIPAALDHHADNKAHGHAGSSSAATMLPEVAQYYTRLPQPPVFDSPAAERVPVYALRLLY